MATGKQLQANLRKLKNRIQTQVPQQVARSMLRETRDNFALAQYGNDKTRQKWPDRFGSIRGKGFGNVESLLRYPKLRYTGKLYQSIQPRYGRGYAELTTPVPYAKAHNEGLAYLGGNSYRKPPVSSVPLKLGRRPKERKFMGVGRRTEENVVKIYLSELRRTL
jgi:phage gpG-like protein